MTTGHLTYSEAVAYLLALPRFSEIGAAAYRPGAERMRDLLDRLSLKDLPYRTVHVGGTNGKGSTASMIAAVGVAAGLRIGLHTSPHLFRINERMRVDGAPCPDAWLAHAVQTARPVLDAFQPSFFEATLALSLLYFAALEVDLAVVEVGIGGRLDATGVVNPELAIITNVGLEHTDLLGDTIAEIAREKAGIVKPGVPVVCGIEDPVGAAVVREAAREVGAPFHLLDDETELLERESSLMGAQLAIRTSSRTYRLQTDIPGDHQVRNVMAAIRASEIVFADVPNLGKALVSGLGRVRVLSGLRGRLEVLRTDPSVVMDVAHNAASLITSLTFAHRIAHASDGALTVIFGAAGDKDITSMARHLSRYNARVFLAHVSGQRMAPVDRLANLFESYGVPITGVGSVDVGVDNFVVSAQQSDVLLITGSHQVASQTPLDKIAAAWVD